MTTATVRTPPIVSHGWLGSATEFQRDQLGLYVSALREYGDVVAFNMGPRGLRTPLYGLFHPDAVQRVLAGGASAYRKDTPIYQEIANQFGNGLLVSQDDIWKRQRRTLQPLFTHLSVAGYVPPMARAAARLVANIRAAARDNGGRVELYSTLLEHATHTLGSVLFNADAAQNAAANTVFQDVLAHLSGYTFRRGISPVRLPAGWPTPGNRSAARARRRLRRIADDLVAARRTRPLSAGDDDLIARLLLAVDPETGAGLSGTEIRDQVLIFLLAGHETAATALTCTLNLLGQHPDVQERVHAEAVEVLSGRQPTAAELPQLSYTSKVVHESLRLFPPAYAIGRHATAEDTVLGYRIPAGAHVIVSPWATHRHPEFWPDPDRFDPERFGSERSADRHRYAYFPFGGGPRACIGSRLAVAEAVIGTAAVLTAYRLRTSDRPMRLAAGITLRPTGQLWCAVTPR